MLVMLTSVIEVHPDLASREST